MVDIDAMSRDGSVVWFFFFFRSEVCHSRSHSQTHHLEHEAELEPESQPRRLSKGMLMSQCGGVHPRERETRPAGDGALSGKTTLVLIGDRQ